MNTQNLTKQQTKILRFIYHGNKKISNIMKKFKLDETKFRLVMSENNMFDYYFIPDDTVSFEHQIINITQQGISYIDAQNQDRFRFLFPNTLSIIALIISAISLIVSLS